MAALLLELPAFAAPFAIEHLEPMSWWVGMRHPELQLMVHGERIAELEPALDYPGVSLAGAERTDNPDYLFIDLLIGASAKPGTLALVLKRGGEVAVRCDYRLEARRPGSRERSGFDARDAIYLITPDRFANAIPSNDSQPDMAEPPNRASPIGRHGGDIEGIRRHLDYIAQLGFTQIWPTPLLENNQPKYSYHGYSITNHYRIDPRFGTNEDFRELVRQAKGKGLGVIQDIVLNHIGTGHWWMGDLPARDWVNHPGSLVLTNNQHTTIPDRHAAPEDRDRFLTGWFAPTMPDLNQRNPKVARYLIQNTLWWIEYADLSGLRVDTFSYSDPEFLRTWCAAVTEEYPNLNIVGEEMDEEPYLTAYWQKGARNRDGYDSGLPSVTDFPVVDLLSTVLNSDESRTTGLIQLYDRIAADCLYANPMNLLVFPDNHDRSRIFSRLHENPDLVRSAVLFAATTRGIPQIYYGTEILTRSPIERNDGLLRADMPGGWASDPVNAFTGQGLSGEQAAMQAFIRRLFDWRKGCAAITSGSLLHYLPESGCYVYFRSTGKDRVMVVINKNHGDSALDLARFQRMLEGARGARNALTGEPVDLSSPLRLKAQVSAAIEYAVGP